MIEQVTGSHAFQVPLVLLSAPAGALLALVALLWRRARGGTVPRLGWLALFVPPVLVVTALSFRALPGAVFLGGLVFCWIYFGNVVLSQLTGHAKGRFFRRG